MKKALLLHGINSWIDKEFIRDVYYSKMSLFNTLQKQITTVNQLGYNINEQAIVNDIDGSFRNIVQTINSSDMTPQDKQER